MAAGSASPDPGLSHAVLDPTQQPVAVPVDNDALHQIADLSGGQFFTASTETELRQVYAPQPQRHAGDHARPPVTADHRWSAPCATFWNPQVFGTHRSADRLLRRRTRHPQPRLPSPRLQTGATARHSRAQAAQLHASVHRRTISHAMLTPAAMTTPAVIADTASASPADVRAAAAGPDRSIHSEPPHGRVVQFFRDLQIWGFRARSCARQAW